MMRHLGPATALVSALLACATPGMAQGVSLDAEDSYDLLFRAGTLEGIDRADTLVYEREVVNELKPQAAQRDTGKVVLDFGEDDAGMVLLELQQGDKHRGLGTFPASVGNPMIMFFYETVVRDMAESAGGSPFYIRNRVKEALTRPGEMETGQAVYDGATIPTKTVHLHPFADDPNRQRMRGFGDLVLSVTMSEEVPGWYLTLNAEAQGTDGPVYRSTIAFEGFGALP